MEHGPDRQLVRALSMAIFLIVLIRTAWISDDAYITMRTVDNFVHGYGPNWNTDERVQAYTHPLWMFLITPVYLATHDAYLSLMGLSLACSLGAFLLVLFKLSRATHVTAFAAVALLASKAFTDYSSSGLENPLTHLLLAATLVVSLNGKTLGSRKRLIILGILVALVGLNRLDLLLLLLPMMAIELRRASGRERLAGALSLVIPLLAWELFSLIYYGSPIPNTAFAKMSHGLPQRDLFEQAFYYFMNSLDWDPITLALIALSLVVGFSRRDALSSSLALGICLYLLYVLWIGGDFMSGRYFAAPLLVSVVVFCNAAEAWPQRSALAVFPFVLLLAFMNPTKSPLLASADYADPALDSIDPHGVADERAVYYDATSLLKIRRNVRPPYHIWVDDGLYYKRLDEKVIVRGSLGFAGFFAGPSIHIVDPIGLTDPLLARLPVQVVGNWRIGHFERVVPQGYVESIRAGSNLIADPNLREYYEVIRVVTMGDVWDWDRLGEILKLNTGGYDRLLQAYARSLATQSIEPDASP